MATATPPTLFLSTIWFPRRYDLRLKEWNAHDGGAWAFDHVDADGSAYGFRGVFQSLEDRDGMLASGMEGGLNESYERLDEVLAEG